VPPLGSSKPTLIALRDARAVTAFFNFMALSGRKRWGAAWLATRKTRSRVAIGTIAPRDRAGRTRSDHLPGYTIDRSLCHESRSAWRIVIPGPSAFSRTRDEACSLDSWYHAFPARGFFIGPVSTIAVFKLRPAASPAATAWSESPHEGRKSRCACQTALCGSVSFDFAAEPGALLLRCD
jgi:hypothetical protein